MPVIEDQPKTSGQTLQVEFERFEAFDYERASEHWKFREAWDGESAYYAYNGYKANVKDYDGDGAGYTLKDPRGVVIFEGECRNFDEGIKRIEMALVKIPLLWKIGTTSKYDDGLPYP